MKILNLLVTLSAICVLSPPVTGIAQTNHSHVLLARNADMILIGEVTYLGKSPYSRESSLILPLTNVASEDQTVVFRVRDVLKGGYSPSFLKLSVVFGVELLTIPTLALKEKRTYILLLRREDAPSACEELKIRDYQQLPCYRISREAVIIATTDEVQAFKWFANAFSRD